MSAKLCGNWNKYDKVISLLVCKTNERLLWQAPNRPFDLLYRAHCAKWLRRYNFAEIASGDRARLIEHLPEIGKSRQCQWSRNAYGSVTRRPVLRKSLKAQAKVDRFKQLANELSQQLSKAERALRRAKVAIDPYNINPPNPRHARAVRMRSLRTR